MLLLLFLTTLVFSAFNLLPFSSLKPSTNTHTHAPQGSPVCLLVAQVCVCVSCATRPLNQSLLAVKCVSFAAAAFAASVLFCLSFCPLLSHSLCLPLSLPSSVSMCSHSRPPSPPRALVLVGCSLIITPPSRLWRSRAVLHCGVKAYAKLAFLSCPKNPW